MSVAWCFHDKKVRKKSNGKHVSTKVTIPYFQHTLLRNLHRKPSPKTFDPYEVFQRWLRKLTETTMGYRQGLGFSTHPPKALASNGWFPGTLLDGGAAYVVAGHRNYRNMLAGYGLGTTYLTPPLIKNRMVTLWKNHANTWMLELDSDCHLSWKGFWLRSLWKVPTGTCGSTLKPWPNRPWLLVAEMPNVNWRNRRIQWCFPRSLWAWLRKTPDSGSFPAFWLAWTIWRHRSRPACKQRICGHTVQPQLKICLHPFGWCHLDLLFNLCRVIISNNFDTTDKLFLADLNLTFFWLVSERPH